MADRGADMPKEVRDQLAELDLELSEGKKGGEVWRGGWGRLGGFEGAWRVVGGWGGDAVADF